MVPSQKPDKSLAKHPAENVNTKETRELENQINDVINSCKEIISKNKSFNSNTPNAGKKKKTKPQKLTTENASEVTLEKVAENMTGILKDLKHHMYTLKNRSDSFSDVVPKIEESFLKVSRQNTNASFFKNHNGKISPTHNTSTRKPPCNSKAETAKNSKGNSVNNSNMNKQSTNSSPKGSIVKSSTKPPTFHYIPRKIPTRDVYDPFGIIKSEVQKAIQERKTFTVKGAFPAVRRALLKRGWIEKLHMSYRDRINDDLKKLQTYTIHELVELLRNKQIADSCKTLIKSKLLANNQVDFYWAYNYDSFKECPDKVKLTKINKFRRDVFSYTSKLGLCNANKKSVWFKIPGVANLNHPRSYSLTKDGDTPEFIKDFNRTAAISLLKWVVKNNITGECKVLSPSGKIPMEVFDFAINECYKFIKKSQHEDIDNDIVEAQEYEWNTFLEYFYKTVQIGNHFKTNSEVSEIDMVRKANYILTKLKEYWPYLEMDGIMNIWILKPTNGSQGVGIHICRTLQYVLRTIKANPNRRYLIQKYIERPFLIHNTKFDIRQWFLISSSEPLTIWMYKRCYLRFSSQTYNLLKLHESIHLTNNSVQCRYPKANRDILLPSYNMWESNDFKNYLSDIGYPNAFDTIIYPGMKECIIAAVIMYQDKLDRRKNCFELYGADFMLTEDFKPWLLEINSNPALHASTPVTAKMCPLVLEDVIKVVVDYEGNKNTNTGYFELIYQKNIPTNIINDKFQVQGTPVTPEYFYTPPAVQTDPEPKEIIRLSLPESPATDTVEYVKQISQGMRKTLEDLLEILKKEKQKRHERKNTGVATISSNIITETRESQTGYKLQSRIFSETLVKAQVLEIDEVAILEVQNARKENPELSSKISSIVGNNKPKCKQSSENNCTNKSCNTQKLNFPVNSEYLNSKTDDKTKASKISEIKLNGIKKSTLNINYISSSFENSNISNTNKYNLNTITSLSDSNVLANKMKDIVKCETETKLDSKTENCLLEDTELNNSTSTLKVHKKFCQESSVETTETNRNKSRKQFLNFIFRKK